MPKGVYKRIIGINCGFSKGKHWKVKDTSNYTGLNGFKKGHKPIAGFQKGHKSFKGTEKTEFKKGNSGYWLGKKRPPFSKETKKKMGESRKGEKSYLWKGGITSLTRQIRHCFEYRQWRSDVLTRDDFTCQKCGIRGGRLETDHYPKSFADIFSENRIKDLDEALNCEEFWNINNGRTLCKECHKLTENYGNRAKHKKKI